MNKFFSWLASVFVPKAEAYTPPINPSGDWSNNLPPWTSQYSVPNRLDAMDCVSESLINIVYMLTGFDGSPRALAKLANTTRSGNSLQAVLNAANQYGLIPYELWPTPDTFEWNDPNNPTPDYYADIPDSVLKQAIRVKIDIIPADLTRSPLWTVLIFPNTAEHAVAQIDGRRYFDSELGDEVKPLSYAGAQIVSQQSLRVKLMISCKTVKYADGKTLGIMIDTPNGTQIIKATGEEQWRSWHKPESYGKSTVNPDGTTNWTAELQLNF